ncbi:hypothetical protein HPS57_08620 [Prevotella sp. PINT]|uniref:hypothetical protein n=1 Tax=Palleniella intestinalis TaxID=2736291 RepID=UPI0015566FA9|nr:hypothetical protein [Palleniella intestinalis]NPD82037.1 hypothetical protein [Palleniella intestinalis]
MPYCKHFHAKCGGATALTVTSGFSREDCKATQTLCGGTTLLYAEHTDGTNLNNPLSYACAKMNHKRVWRCHTLCMDYFISAGLKPAP